MILHGFKNSKQLFSIFNSARNLATFMPNPSPLKLKIIALMFLAAGIWGISMGLFVFQAPNTSFFVTVLGVVNFTLGVFLGFRVLRRSNHELKRKK